MNLINSFKKYRYRTFIALRYMPGILRRKLVAPFFDYQKRDLAQFDVSRLPFPVKWEKYIKYKSIYCEIGTGHGETLRHLVSTNPENLYVGLEITAKYSRQTRKKVKSYKNAVAYKAEASAEIMRLFSKNTLDGIYILFPDPWHKKRQNKRRLLNSIWLKKVHNVLKPGATIFFATDWPDYYEFVLEQAKLVSSLYSVKSGAYSPEKFGLVPTYYYSKWKKIGREFKYVSLTSK